MKNSRVLEEFAAIDDPASVSPEESMCTTPPHPDVPAKKLKSQDENVAAAPPDSVTVTCSV